MSTPIVSSAVPQLLIAPQQPSEQPSSAKKPKTLKSSIIDFTLENWRLIDKVILKEGFPTTDLPCAAIQDTIGMQHKIEK